MMPGRLRPILVVDDKQTNLEILKAFLTPAGYDVVTATDGAEAWALLERQDRPYRTVLLDRMMPKMDGIELLRHMKRHPTLKHVPVIMQTAARGAHEVLEGIQAGAYYYLTKPYRKNMLVSIVHAAVQDYENYLELQEEIRKHAHTMRLLISGVFRFRTLTEARDLAALVAKACPDPSRVVMGLVELLVNAVEHGNLGITYEEKTQLDECGELEAEIARRLASPEYGHKFGEMEFTLRDDTISIMVTDQGSGFDWRRYLTLDEKRAFDRHGRGIAMAKMLSFDAIEYRGSGNQVVCTILLNTQSQTAHLACHEVFTNV